MLGQEWNSLLEVFASCLDGKGGRLWIGRLAQKRASSGEPSGMVIDLAVGGEGKKGVKDSTQGST